MTRKTLLAFLRSLAGNVVMVGLALLCIGLDPWAWLANDR